MFAGTPYQLQEIEATDTITWNQCLRSFAIVAPDDNIGSMVIRDFQNVNGDVQLNPYEGWYWIPRFDITGPQVLEYHPIGQDVDPNTTRGVRVVFDRPMQDSPWERRMSCEISPPKTDELKTQYQHLVDEFKQWHEELNGSNSRH